jgi:dTDP-4-amino-4,6-dideoxygalactose transaminase
MGEIGGDFCLADLDTVLSDGEQSYFDVAIEWYAQRAVSSFSSGRAAYYAVLNRISDHMGHLVVAWLPSYLCPAMVEPFRLAGMNVGFYPVHADLSVDVEELCTLVGARPSVVVVCDYFGFHQSLCVMADPSLSLSNEHFVVYDATHAALDQRPGDSVARKPDVCLLSLRKMLPVVDGALVIWTRENGHSCLGTPATLSESASLRALAMVLKASYLASGKLEKGMFLSLYGQSENLISEEYAATQGMSQLSWSMLRRVGVHRARSNRRENYLRLLDLVRGLMSMRPLYTELPEGVYPLGFPVVCEDRDALRNFLIQNQVYCPVHWVLPDEVSREEFPESHWLSQRILTIPCDQRYTSTDMIRIADILAAF